MAVERIIGVDFGTSTSVIRVKRYENGNPVGEKLETKEVIFSGSYSMTPTLISKKNDNTSVCYIGYDASDKTGKQYTQFQGFKMDLESSDPAKRAQARSLTEEFYGYLAKQYKSQSDGGHLGNSDDKERTIISYPVKWSEETKHFMLETAKKAGFPNVTGMDEAQAAIQAVIVMSTDHLQKHGLLKNGVGANILLIDMGAGTTDLVLARYIPGDTPKTEVLNTWPKSGDIQFGGREVDDLLQNFFRELLHEDHAEKVFRRIGADKFKSWKERSVSPALHKGDSVNQFAALDNYVEDMEYALGEYCLDRAAFENCLADYMKQFPELVNGCLQNAGMSGSDVDLVIVTGGHSQWYFVNEMLCGKMPRFGSLDLPKIRENPARIIPITRPQETVALGLAYSGIHFDMSAGTADAVQDREAVLSDFGRTLNAVQEQKQEQTYETDAEDFMMKFDPATKAFALSGQGTVVVGTIVQGAVKIGDKVYVCGGPGRSRIAQVKNIALHQESKNVTTARKGDCIAVLLSGISANDASGATYIASKPDDCVELPVDPVMQHSDSKETKWAGFKDAARKAVDTVHQSAQQAAEQKRMQELEEARRRAAAIMQIDPESIPYTPENEFELGSVGRNDCSIKKYVGSRPVVKIPPTIRGRKVVEIAKEAFGANFVTNTNTTLEAVIIPDTVVRIGDVAFCFCKNLRYVRANMVRDIGNSAFANCVNLDNPILGKDIVSIGSGAFAGCTNLKTAAFGNNVERIGMNAFLGCRNLRKLDFDIGDCQEGHVIFPPKLKSIGACAFHTNELLHGTRCIFKEIQMSRRTKVTNLPATPCFNPKYCAVFYYD